MSGFNLEAQLYDEVLEEQHDTEYSQWNHGSDHCYNKGCRGPLCRHARRVRDMKRRGIEESTWMTPVDKYYRYIISIIRINPVTQPDESRAAS